uniref:Uncharacterized protein n=1 Tax=Arundo donax TaxID=35708 RepID=A0A0A9HZ23_ARUDO
MLPTILPLGGTQRWFEASYTDNRWKNVMLLTDNMLFAFFFSYCGFVCCFPLRVDTPSLFCHTDGSQ